MSFYEKGIKNRQVGDVASVGIRVDFPRVSVIVPTYYDWSRLKKCVAALDNQSLARDNFEVIIVNNAPDDSPPADFYLP